MTKPEYKFETILIDKQDDGITWVTFNRPEKRNAITPKLSEEMNIALDKMADDPEVRVLIFTGAGVAFCAGMDLKVFYQYRDRPQKDWVVPGFGSMDWWRKIREYPKITISAVNGFAFGGGVMPVVYSDLAIASDKAIFGLSEINFGMPPGGGATTAILESMLLKHAKWMIITGQSVPATEAARIGLINFCVPDDKLKEEALRIATICLPHNPIAQKYVKLQMRLVQETSNHEHSVRVEGAVLNEMKNVEGYSGAGDGLKAFSEGKYKPGLQSHDFRK